MSAAARPSSPATRSRCSTTPTISAPARSIAPMEHRALGRSGVDVSRIILGCGNFGGIGSSPAFFGAGETEAEAHALLDAAWEAGITTYDTADAYGGGRSESYLGNWLRSQGPDVRDRIVLTTKTFNPMTEGADSGLAPARVRRQLATSLERLGVDAVDLYLPHAMDDATPVAETDRRLRRARRRGIDPRLRRQQRRRGLARGGAPPRPPRLGAELALAAGAGRRGRRPPCRRAGRPRLHALQPAGRRLADGEVPPRRGAAGGVADDAAARALPPSGGRSRLRRARGVRGDRAANGRRPLPHSRSPGCSVILTSPRSSSARAAPISSAQRSRRSSSTSPRPSTSSSRSSSHERPRPRRAPGPLAADDGRVHRGDGGGAALAGARRAAPAAPARDATRGLGHPDGPDARLPRRRSGRRGR